MPVVLGIIVGVLAFVPLLLALTSARSQKLGTGVGVGLVALGVSFIVMMASTLVCYLALGRGTVFFVIGLLVGFIAVWICVAMRTILGGGR